MNLYQVAEEITRRLAGIFLRDTTAGVRFMADPGSSRRTRTGGICVLFYEYFHGDNGAGLGASHQTGWTGIIARAMHMFATSTAEQVLELGQKAAIVETESRMERGVGRSGDGPARVTGLWRVAYAQVYHGHRRFS